jgi:hypothetical protein
MGSRKIERNEPCPCGSGKKYKKYCVGKKQPDKSCKYRDINPVLPNYHEID